MIYVGIDNGLDGGIVAIDENRNVVIGSITPFIVEKKKKSRKRHYNTTEMKRVLSEFPIGSAVYVVLEKAQAMPGQGVSSMFSIGRGFGLWEGLLVGLGIPYSVVHPRTWQASVCKDVQGDTKTRSVITCQRMIPTLDLTPGKKRKPHDGLADAACMALYGLKEWGRK